VANTGATPLSAAVSMRHVEIVDRLLAAGAQLEQRLPGEVTVLMLAAALGLPEMCARLMTAGANVHATDAQGLTPLHCAALYGFTARDRTRLVALFDTLLLAGAEVDAVAAGGVTPLLLLLGARAEPGSACDEDVLKAVVEQLLDEGADLDARDPRGFGPLHLAALHGLLQLTRRLLRAGADPEARDALNRTPREIAVMRGFVDVAHENVPAPTGVSMARFLRDRGRGRARPLMRRPFRCHGRGRGFARRATDPGSGPRRVPTAPVRAGHEPPAPPAVARSVRRLPAVRARARGCRSRRPDSRCRARRTARGRTVSAPPVPTGSPGRRARSAGRIARRRCAAAGAAVRSGRRCSVP